MIDLELLKTYAIDLLTQKTENGVGLETLGEYTKTITSFITFINNKCKDNEHKDKPAQNNYILLSGEYISLSIGYIREEDLKPITMDYFTSCVVESNDNAEKLGKITEIITVYIGYITETLEKEGECET